MEESVIMKPLWEQFQIYSNPFVPEAQGFLMFSEGRERAHWEQMG